MTALLFPTLQFWNALGTAPLSGGCIQAYITGTTTPLATALDSAGTAAPNPVPLDGGGRPNSGNGLWLNIGSSYDLLIYNTPTATGTPVETLTNVQSGNTGVAPNTASYVTVSAETNLSNERVLTAGGGVTILDGGSTVTIAQSSVVNAQTAGYTIISSDRGKFILYTGAGGVTLALTAASTLGNGFTFTVINRSSGTITIDPNGAELINGSATYTLLTGAIITVYCDGTSFYTGPAFSTWTVPQGGTGVTTMTTAYCPVISGTTATGNLQTTATAGTSGQPLLSGGASALPAYGTLAVGGGGTGATTLTGAVVGNGTGAFTAGTLSIGNGGTGQTTATAAFNLS